MLPLATFTEFLLSLFSASSLKKSILKKFFLLSGKREKNSQQTGAFM